MEGYIRDRAVKGRHVVGALEGVMKESVGMEKEGNKELLFCQHCHMHQRHGHVMQHSFENELHEVNVVYQSGM